jgi:hypothetical protein
MKDKASKAIDTLKEKYAAAQKKADEAHAKREEAREAIRTSVTKARKELEDEEPETGVIAKYKHAAKVDARAHEIRREARKKLKANGGHPALESPTRYNHEIKESVTNPDVEDFPKAEGTHSAEGNGVPVGMSHEDDSVQPAYTYQSDFEQKEVGVEDGGTDAIDVIKANESVSRYMAIIEAAKAKATDKEVCPKCGKDPCECEC